MTGAGTRKGRKTIGPSAEIKRPTAGEHTLAALSARLLVWIAHRAALCQRGAQRTAARRAIAVVEAQDHFFAGALQKLNLTPLVFAQERHPGFSAGNLAKAKRGLKATLQS